MLEDIKNLYDDIIYATKDNRKITEKLKSIKGDLICVGAGGSKVVAKYAEKVLAKKNKLIAVTLDAHSLRHFNMELYDNVFIVSHSGTNFGVKASLDNNLNKYLLSTRKTGLKNVTLLNYTVIKRPSFISLSATLIPMAILLKYYLGNKFIKTLDKVFREAKKFRQMKDLENIKDDVNYNIFTGIDSETASFFLESTFIEAGLNVPIINYKYDYCHGRSTINKKHANAAIYLGYDGTDLDCTLKRVLKKTMKDVIILKKISKDDIINDFYFTLISIYLVAFMAEKKNISLKNIDYDRCAVHELYYFKGSM